MKIGVFGAGGVGGYFGAVLARAGYPVTIVARGEHLRAICTAGLRVQSPKGDFAVMPAQATDDPSQIGPLDAVIVGVKAWQVRAAAAAIRPLIGRNTRVVPLQNGVEAANQLMEVLGEEHVVGGLCRIIASIAAPGVICHSGMEPTVVLGELDGSELRAGARELLTAFRAAGVSAQATADIRARLWEKLLFIAGISGAGAVARAMIGEVRRIPETRKLLQELMEEAAAVAFAQGVHLAEDIVLRTLAFIDTLPADGTASMQRDVVNGRPSELEAINGTIVRLGKALGVPTPTNDFVYASLLPCEVRARGLLSHE
jgi:2-dehydropantoate 2-reductase